MAVSLNWSTHYICIYMNVYIERVFRLNCRISILLDTNSSLPYSHSSKIKFFNLIVFISTDQLVPCCYWHSSTIVSLTVYCTLHSSIQAIKHSKHVKRETISLHCSAMSVRALTHTYYLYDEWVPYNFMRWMYESFTLYIFVCIALYYLLLCVWIGATADFNHRYNTTALSLSIASRIVCFCCCGCCCCFCCCNCCCWSVYY